MTKTNTVAILGAGSWGTAVAIHLATAGHRVLLWGHDPEQIKAMAEAHCNVRYLPDSPLPPNLTPSNDLQQCLTEANHVILAVPSHAFAEVLSQLPKSQTGISWLTKGLDPKTHKLLSELVAEKWGETYPMAVISGPSFAQEVAHFLPTALTVAGNDAQYLQNIRDILHHNNVRVYLSEDMVGVQLCGAVKNVLAIACGISDGLNYGANAKAALITRGLAEMRRLGKRLGARAETFMGLAGLGDLVLTCTDNQSRNRRFGLMLGQGINIAAAEKQIGQVVEGKHNASQVCALAAQYHVEMPICNEVNNLLQEKITPGKAVENLMTRPPREE
ncbi:MULTISPECIES: NAD(P)H-dependent glycerol-3-phosphate dehydrogenase [Legionella]|uniref:Glycerol-3-phosphate dehydrogenase [NAD(P)+] n=1 Tax=Legionella septentrionalis TaxID=2498109 RepID=A0A433JMK1_9GAMM|nr:MULTISPECIES: NAD(P)H-dependent glycerol-3-phosphate dehydrogenase [Legionella]MCP0913095.1 NAD(P)-dependent glycerol-3-phosphate dehydrogenase [Legionella sp. 27cVA30]RUQ91545.1 NAD(P)-dependent glycerol-3-phosphate dehydrogenase [Legionella septentrionalis]RUQ94981.1 NAD(P)-dependent glycerol-3-phosphate dehydrogenase [Legionella septentrionalis]RUR13773.1 NAD(P)-dependent glycerol-3-phosphate dehydrogenase [Legionella septentrionalis]